MAHFRVTEMWCDGCDVRALFDTLADARLLGWEWGRYGLGRDFCPACTEQGLPWQQLAGTAAAS
jgi:hypothetical protein